MSEPPAAGGSGGPAPRARRLAPYLAAGVALSLVAFGAWRVAATRGARPGRGADAGRGEAAVWTCPLHPGVRRPEPGRCPVHGTDLVPLVPASPEAGPAGSAPAACALGDPGEPGSHAACAHDTRAPTPRRGEAGGGPEPAPASPEAGPAGSAPATCALGDGAGLHEGCAHGT